MLNQHGMGLEEDVNEVREVKIKNFAQGLLCNQDTTRRDLLLTTGSCGWQPVCKLIQKNHRTAAPGLLCHSIVGSAGGSGSITRHLSSQGSQLVCEPIRI